MAAEYRRTEGRRAPAGASRQRTPLREHLEYFAGLILVVVLLRQVVVEAFRIQHGSMAPTLLGVHQEIRCPNCGWTFDVGRSKVSYRGEVECPNCRYTWAAVPPETKDGMPLAERWPEWLWNTAVAADGTTVSGTAGANMVKRGASRIFVDKLRYRFRQPRRWDVVVFVYPQPDLHCRDCGLTRSVVPVDDMRCPGCGGTNFTLTMKNYIKRVAGLPGEVVALRDGDVFINGTIARKPRRVQEGVWLHVFDTAFTPREGVRPTWDFGGSERLWQQDEESGALTMNARGSGAPVMAAFAPQIVDYYAYDGLSFGNQSSTLYAAGRNEVGDCRVRALVHPMARDRADGAALLQIQDAGHTFTLSAAIGGRGGAVLEVDGARLVSAGAPPLLPGHDEWLCLENYDGRVVARVGGKEVAAYEFDPGPRGPRHVRFGARGAAVRWQRVVIQRDIHYASTRAEGPGAVYEVGDHHYFMLGDNSPASYDSRSWSVEIPAENIVGKALLAFWPVHHIRGL